MNKIVAINGMADLTPRRMSPNGKLNRNIYGARIPRRYAILLILCVISWVSASSGCHPCVADNEQELPVFDGVTTQFTLTRSRIKKDQPLEVRAIIRNISNTTKRFRCLDFDVDARLYSNGQLLENRCEQGLDFPLKVITLKPGETSEGSAKVFTPSCYNLAPGQYSIRFNYNLRAIADESLRSDYEKKYGHPPGGIVPWDGQDHPFIVEE